MLEQQSASSRPRETRRRLDRNPGRQLPVVLGPYELFDHIGRGGMADIYRARQRTDGAGEREVVIKEVLPELASKERMVELLAEEAKLAAQLVHPNVVRIEQLSRHEGTLYIAMEWVDGLDLRDLLRRCGRQGVELPLELSLHITCEVLRALDFAHRAELLTDHGARRQGLVHRDVSPSNVLLSKDGEVKLCDFGIARAHDGRTEECDEELVEGKALYMSPEQACGFALDGRADVFAAGIVLWELLSGRRFHRRAAGESMLALAQGAGPKPLACEGYPDQQALQAILDRALASDPEQRFSTAGDFRDTLLSYASKHDLQVTSRSLRRFIEQHFAPELARTRRRRELATSAMASGPLAVLEVLDVPVLGMTAEVAAGPREGAEGDPRPSLAPTRARVALGKLMLFGLAAIMLAFLIFRALQSDG